MEIFDDFLHDDELSYLKEYVQEKSWRPQYSSPTNPYRLPFLKCFTPKQGKKQFIPSFPNVDARFFFHNKIFSRIKKLIGEYTIDDVYLNSKKTVDNRNYIVGDRDENTFSLTSSLAASALGAWVLFGPASAAT